MIINTPKPPYYTVILTSVRTFGDDGYEEMSTLLDDEVKKMEGYLGHESARNDICITISYWRDLESIAKWKRQSEHLTAQKLGINTWYECYTVRIAKVERAYSFTNTKEK